MRKTLKFKWTVSRGRDSYGYNICSLWVDRVKVSSCNGGGYDMRGAVLGDWIAKEFETKLLELKEEFYGLSFHDPGYDPSQAVIDGQTVGEREEEGISIGLERYQAFQGASSKVPTDKHIIPLMDGACGFSSIERILNAIGYKLEYIDESSNSSIYLLTEA